MIEYLVVTVDIYNGNVACLGMNNLDQKETFLDGNIQVTPQKLADRNFDYDVLHVLGKNDWKLVTSVRIDNEQMFYFMKEKEKQNK